MSFSNNVSGNFLRLSELLKKISYSARRFLLVVSGGLLTGLTLVFPEIGFLEWLTLVPVGIVLIVRASDKEIRFRSLYLDGLIFFYSFFLTCFHWFTYLYPLDFVEGMTKGGALAVVLVAWLGLSLFQAVLSAFSFVLIGVIFRTRFCERFIFSLPFVAAGIWAIFEWSQTLGWWGVPWGRLPIGQTEYLVGLQNASLFGSYFVTFMLVAVNFWLAYVLLYPPKIKVGILTVAALLIFQYASGVLLWFSNDVTKGEKIKVACIQGNISSAEKWDNSSFYNTLENYSRYTIQAAEQGAQLVIWPETSFPYDISKGGYAIYAESFCMLAKQCNIYLLVGSYVTDEQGNLLNSLVGFTPEGEQIEDVYSKRHLVPFGEYVPMKTLIQTLIPPLAELVLSEGEIYAGEGAQTVEIGNGVKIGGLICFDSIYEQLTLESVRDGAELICLSTNDSWFIDSKALYMHNAQAQIRAIESGRYVARAANTGISTVINSRGEVTDELEPLVGGIIVSDVYATDENTLWRFLGNGFVYLLMLSCALIIVDNSVFKFTKKIKHNALTL